MNRCEDAPLGRQSASAGHERILSSLRPGEGLPSVRSGPPLRSLPGSVCYPAAFHMDRVEPEITQRVVSDPLSLLFLGRPEAPSTGVAQHCISKADEDGFCSCEPSPCPAPQARGQESLAQAARGEGCLRWELGPDCPSALKPPPYSTPLHPIPAPHSRLAVKMQSGCL